MTSLLVTGCYAKREVPTTFVETRAQAKIAGKGCEQGPNFDPYKGDAAWSLLNSELLRCPNDDGSDVEPSWAVNPWFTKCSVYGSCDTPTNKQGVPLIQLEPLVQRLGGKVQTLSLAPLTQPSGVVLQAGSAPPSSVLFNSSAATIIQNSMAPGLWPRRQRSPIAKSRLGVTPFRGKDARAFKLAFQEVDLNLCLDQKESECTLPMTVFTGARTERPILLLMNTKEPCGDKFVPTGSLPKVPIDCFYYVVPDAKATLTKSVSQGKEVSTFKTRGELRLQHQFGGLGKVEVLVGFHLIASDQPAWTWTTFWWSPENKGHGRCLNGSKALACQIPWAFYDMDDQRYDAKKKNKPGAHFNPYIETNGGSNCIYCHARALHHSNGKPAGQIDFDRARNYTDGPLLPCFAAEAGKTAASLSPHDVSCADATPTHFLWSLARNLEEHPPPPPAQPKAGAASGHP